jgi:hypothetical protein
MLDRDLRQKQSPIATAADEKPMAANLDRIRGNSHRTRKNAQLNRKVRYFFGRDWIEPRVIECGRARGFRNRSVQRSHRQNITDASAQFAVKVQRSENAARLGQMCARGVQRNLSLFESGQDRVVCQTQQN